MVLLDVRMPDHHGISQLKQIREVDSDVVVIAMTAYPSVESAVETLKAYGIDCLRKPFELDQLRQVIQRAVREKGLLVDADERLNQKIGSRIRALRKQRTLTLKQLANISAPDADLLVIKPFDPGGLGDIEKAIMKSDVGIHPSSDGKVIRLQIPPLSQERRQQLANRAKETAEESRIAVRNIRRDANKHADEIKKTMSEDDVKALKNEVLELVKTFEKKIDQMLADKSEELTSF